MRVCLAGLTHFISWTSWHQHQHQLTHITSWTSWPASASWTSWPASASCCSSSSTSESSLWASTIGPIGTSWTQSSQSLCGWFNQIVIFHIEKVSKRIEIQYVKSYLIFLSFFTPTKVLDLNISTKKTCVASVTNVCAMSHKKGSPLVQRMADQACFEEGWHRGRNFVGRQ